MLFAWLTKPWWTVAIARSLVCENQVVPSDAVLIENFDPGYQLFEQARLLREKGLASRVLVPVATEVDSPQPQPVALATTEMLARLARLGAFEVVPIREVEPISLHAGIDVRRFLEREGLKSVLVVTPLFRSRRSALVYGATLGPGVTVRCAPTTEGTRSVTTWTRTWHGVQEVTEQWIKLQYYRLWVLPFFDDAR